MAKKPDGKIRIRCTGCGKRVKFPAGHPGETFRCPLCKTTIVAPLNANAIPELEESLDIKQESPYKAAQQQPGKPISQPRRRAPEQAAEATPKPPIAYAEPATPIPAPTATKPAPTPSAPKRALDAIEKVAAFANTENKRIAQLTRNVLMNAGLPEEKHLEQLRELRHQKAVHLRRYVEAVLKDLDGNISQLRDDPASETATGKKRLNRLVRERKQFLLYIKVMFEFRKGIPAAAPPPATRGTPAAAKAPPSTSPPQATQTPPGKGGASPAPGDKAPDSNASQAC